MIEAAKTAFEEVKLVDLDHPSLHKLSFRCEGRVPVYVHPSFYRALKLTFPLDVGGASRDGQFASELLTGSLGHACCVLTPEDFRPVCDTA